MTQPLEEQDNLFEIDPAWKEEWEGMPEYNNTNYPLPAVVVTFNFLTVQDYEKFYSIIKECLFNGEKPFDGRQEKTHKTAWYPHKEKAHHYVYQDES